MPSPRRRFIETHVVVAVVLALVVACQPSQPRSSVSATRFFGPLPSPPPTLATAISRAVHLGPAGDTTTGSLSFALKGRQPERLAALIASGQTVTPEAYAAEFGLDPAMVKVAVASLQSAGFKASWRLGYCFISANSPA